MIETVDVIYIALHYITLRRFSARAGPSTIRSGQDIHKAAPLLRWLLTYNYTIRRRFDNYGTACNDLCRSSG